MADEDTPTPGEGPQSIQEQERLANEQLEAVANSPDRQLLLRVLEKHLPAKPDDQTYRLIERCVAPILGTEGFFELAWISRDGDTADSDHLSDVALSLVAEVVALYGPQLARAWYENPSIKVSGHDWSGIQHSLTTRFETGERTTDCSIRISKRNGDVVYLEAPSRSLLRLAGRLLNVVLQVDPAELEQSDVEDVFQLATALRAASLDTAQTPSEIDGPGVSTSADSE